MIAVKNTVNQSAIVMVGFWGSFLLHFMRLGVIRSCSKIRGKVSVGQFNNNYEAII